MENNMIDVIYNRQSTSKLKEPSPSHEDLLKMVKLAVTVPDHGLIEPYRFHIFQGESRAKFAEALVSSAMEVKPDLSEGSQVKIGEKAFKAPTVVAIVCQTKKCKIPRWEQEATSACAGYAITLGAHLLGYGAMWKSFAYSPGKQMQQLLGLGEESSLLGWINIGSTDKEHFKRERPVKNIDAFINVH